MSAAMGFFFQWTLERVQNSRGKRDIGVRAIAVLLYRSSKTNIVFYFIPSSESSAYLKQIKCILSAVKKYRIFSLVTDTIFIFSL